MFAALVKNISNIKSRLSDNTEVEVRFGSYTQPKIETEKRLFIPGIPLQVFTRLKSYLNDNHFKGVESITRSETDENGVRRSRDEKGNDVWIRKNVIEIKDYAEFGFRLSIAVEQEVAPVKNFKPIHQRDKKRTSYLINNIASVDLTQVTTGNEVIYEVEIELTERLNNFGTVIELILRLVQDSHIAYTQGEKKVLTDYLNQLFHHRNISDLKLRQLRNLKFKDLVWGGIAGNRETGYAVAHKADGERKLLIFAPNGIWLFHPPYNFNYLSRDVFITLTGTVLDGELIPESSRLEGSPAHLYWYHIFDCLAFQGNREISYRPHVERMVAGQRVADAAHSPLIQINTLSWRGFNTPEEFFDVMRLMFKEKESLPYREDGLVFSPAMSPYQIMVKAPNEKRAISVTALEHKFRSLTHYPDLVKWKPSPLLTIDFLVRWDAKTSQLGLYVKDKEDLILFKGTRSYPFSGYLDKIPSLLASIPDNSIVEFAWKETFVPIIIRHNKVNPNNLKIALDIWEDIQNPIEEKDLLGGDFSLFRHYLDRIERSLIQAGANETCLDLTGHNNLALWKDFSKVVAWYDGKINDLPNRVRLIKEDEAIITTTQSFIGQVDVIALHQDLEFWSSPEDLDFLSQIITKLIKPTGRVVFLTLDGDAISELFSPAMVTPLFPAEMSIGDTLVSYHSEEEIVTLTSSGGEKEVKPLFIYDLVLRLPAMTIGEIHRGETEELLPLPDKIMARLYAFGFLYFPTPSVEEVVKEVPKLPRAIDQPLPTLVVGRPRKEGEPGLGDDRIEKLNVPWTKEEIYRIAAIGDGSCFFHAYLKGFLKEYQENNSYSYRLGLARKLRQSIAQILPLLNPNDEEGRSYYQTLAGGIFPEISAQQGPTEGIDYSLEGMVKLLKSNQDVGDEVYALVSELIGLGIVVVIGTKRNLRRQISINEHLPSIVIVGNEVHYELIGVMRYDILQTIFDPTDPFLLSLPLK